MKYNIGDRVKVISPRDTYTSYSGMFKKLGFQNEKDNPSLKKDTEATIFNIGNHESGGALLIAIRTDDGREALMGQRGIKLIETYSPEIY